MKQDENHSFSRKILKLPIDSSNGLQNIRPSSTQHRTLALSRRIRIHRLILNRIQNNYEEEETVNIANCFNTYIRNLYVHGTDDINIESVIGLYRMHQNEYLTNQYRIIQHSLSQLKQLPIDDQNEQRLDKEFEDSLKKLKDLKKVLFDYYEKLSEQKAQFSYLLAVEKELDIVQVSTQLLCRCFPNQAERIKQHPEVIENYLQFCQLADLQTKTQALTKNLLGKLSDHNEQRKPVAARLVLNNNEYLRYLYGLIQQG